MDKQAFDDLTRLLGAGVSRRRMLRAAIGSAAAVTVVSASPRNGQVLAQDETCGVGGDACETIEDCCEPYTCFEGLCDIPRGCVEAGSPCVNDFPCCDGSTCVDGTCTADDGACGVGGDACESNDDCCSPYTCFEAICDVPRGCVGEGLPCVDDFPCCEDDGLTCTSAGVCGVADTSNGETPGDSTTLPATGVGPSSGSPAWISLMAAGGAAAAMAAFLRRGKRSADQQI